MERIKIIVVCDVIDTVQSSRYISNFGGVGVGGCIVSMSRVEKANALKESFNSLKVFFISLPE
jgi:galactokinase